MILCLVVVHASVFNTTRQVFFCKSERKAFFVSFVALPANIFGNFLFNPPSFVNTNFNVRNS